MDEPQQSELAARLERLEALVDGLLRREAARQGVQVPEEAPARAAAPSRPVAPSAPAPRMPHVPMLPPPEASKPISPTVWIAGAGATIFLLGVIFFFVWSIQQGWIGPETRILMGLLAGGGLVALATRLTLKGRGLLGAVVLLAGLGTLQFSFRVGAFSYHLFAPTLGFGGTALATFYAGVLAARARSGAALSLALVSAFIAPLAFSEGGHHEVALALYLAVIMGATLAVPYVSGWGACWPAPRWIAVVGTWLLLSGACSEVQTEDAVTLMLLLSAHLVLVGLWIWLPRMEEEKPSTPTTLWLLVSVVFTSLLWVLWKDLNWTHEWFAGPVLVLAVLHLALVRPLRIRMEGHQADFGLLALAAGHLALAIPVALNWRWVGPLWGCYALFLAWAARRSKALEADEADSLALLATGLALLATGRWMFHGFEATDATPFFRMAFAEGALASLAWLLLSDLGGVLGGLAFVGLQIVANLTLALEAAHAVRWFQGPPAPVSDEYRYYSGYMQPYHDRAASIAMTLVFALSGVGQWIAGLQRGRKPLVIAGYALMGVAAFKLVAYDLSSASVPLRALAFLGVGGIFLAAALLGDKLRGGVDA